MKTAPWLLAQKGELVAGRTVELDPVESRHAGGALRLKPGREVVLTDGAGTIAFGVLSLVRRGTASVDIETVESVTAPGPGLTLAMGVLAGTAMDLVVQKAVELGIVTVVPVCCDRSQVGLKRSNARADHWERVARQALKQCRRAWAMDVSSAVSLAGLLTDIERDRGVVAQPDGGGFETFDTAPDPVLLVGPEGGFTLEEGAMIARARWPRLGLGPYVLRAETAAIAGSAVLLSQRGKKSGIHS